MTDFNLISDLLPIIANIYFNGRLNGQQQTTSFSLDLGQAAILLGVGLQRKSVDNVAKELELPIEQGYALLNKSIRRLSNHFDTICRDSIELDSIMEEQSETKNNGKRIRVSHFDVEE
uniref:Possible tRNA binding domain-containing protein n=1 Tax=Meloidogyne floridensis TaxID=298350 RepID=A0A915P3Y5_9BILA